MKFIREQYKGFILGIIVCALFASLMGTAAVAAGKITNIKVFMGGIKLYVDGKLVIPTDAKGKVVEPFIYDGTTYLPIRALSNALTNNVKKVSWNGAKSSVYVGQAPVASQTDISKLVPYENGTYGYVLTGEDAAFEILDKKITPFNRLESSIYTYILDSNYSELNGQYIIPYTNLGDDRKSSIKFYNVNKKGDKTLIQEINTAAGDNPKLVNVDLRGVEILFIDYNDTDGALYNVTLSGIK
jgi:hypothetical protein